MSRVVRVDLRESVHEMFCRREASSGLLRTVGASRCAAVGVVTEGVNVHATLGVGIVAGNIPCDGGSGGLGGLLEGNSTGDLRVTSDDSDYRKT